MSNYCYSTLNTIDSMTSNEDVSKESIKAIEKLESKKLFFNAIKVVAFINW